MREIIIYVADDGTQFRDEMECVKYEEKRFMNGALVAYDENFEYLDMKQIGLEEWAERAIYLRVIDPDKAMEILAHVHEVYGYEWPEEFTTAGDVWAWEDYAWINLTAKLENLEEKMAKINRDIA